MTLYLYYINTYIYVYIFAGGHLFGRTMLFCALKICTGERPATRFSINEAENNIGYFKDVQDVY